MWLIGAMIIGALAGLVAKLLLPGRHPGGFLVTLLLGIAGAVMAMWAERTLGWSKDDDTAGLVGAVIGAAIVLLAHRLRPRG